jgi:hypothetical protein
MQTGSALLLSVLMTAFGCGQKETGGPESKTDSGVTAPGEPGTDLATAKPDVTMKAADWHAEFKKDKGAARAKYIGKIIELTGHVSVVDQVAGVTFIHLEEGIDALGVQGVRCGFKDPNLWERVSVGSDVIVRGRLPEQQQDLFLPGELMPVHVVRVDNRSPSVTAAELAERFLKDQEALKEKWDSKWVYVEGEFVRSGMTPHGGLEFVLKGSGKVQVKCLVPGDAEKRVRALKPGQKVKVLGELGLVNGPTLSTAYFRGL